MLASMSVNPLPPFLPHVVRPQAPKSSHFDPWRPKRSPNSTSKNFKFVMRNTSAAGLPQRTLSKIDFFDFLSIFEAPGASQNWAKIAKIRKKTLKIRRWKKHAVQHYFFTIFLRFNLLKKLPNRAFFQYVLKTSILRKSLRNTGCAHKNQGSDFQKTKKICKKSKPKRVREKHRKKTSQKSILASILAPQTLPKRLEKRPGTAARRSLFRDAMEIARRSSEAGGSRRF